MATAQAEALRSVLRPYLLRRTKADVEASLLPPSEQLIYVEMTMFQKQAHSRCATGWRSLQDRRLREEEEFPGRPMQKVANSKSGVRDANGRSAGVPRRLREEP